MVKGPRLHLIARTTDPHVYEFVETFTMIPVTLLTLAALTPDRYEITVIDEAVEKIVPRECDLAAFSVMYYTAKKSYELAEWYRRRGIPVIMGGGHPTLCPEEVAPHCDTLVIGEADRLWGEILRDFEQGRLKPVYREEEKPDLADLPVPRHDLVDKGRYDLQNLVQTGRGCSFGCDFCAVPVLNGRRSRHKSVAQVVEEVEASVRTARGPWKRLITFCDDNIVNSRKYARELFKALIPLQVAWVSQCSLTIAYDEDLLDLAAQSGCRGLFIGFENPRQESLDEVHKRYDVSRYGEYIRRIKERKILVLGSFLFGLGKEGVEIFRETLDFCMRHSIDFVNFHIVSPTPGTPFYRRLAGEGRLLHRRWEYYQERVSFRPGNMSVEELQEGPANAYRQYLSCGNILRRCLRYWNSPARLAIALTLNLRFRRKVFEGISRQRKFLPYRGREIPDLQEPEWSAAGVTGARRPLPPAARRGPDTSGLSRFRDSAEAPPGTAGRRFHSPPR